MRNEIIYCPVIKGKQNDLKAFALVPRDLADKSKPVYELPPFRKGDKVEIGISKFVKRMSKFAPSKACYIDCPVLDLNSTTSWGDEALAFTYGSLTSAKVVFEPVYGFDRDPSFWPLVAKQAKQSGGMLLRLDNDDLESPEDTVDQIRNLKRFGLDLSDMDVMIDCRSLVSKSQALQLATDIADFADLLANAGKPRKFIVSGSVAPKTVALVPKDSLGEIERHELTLWAALQTDVLPWPVTYSDYGVIHPDFSDQLPATHINGKIRYSKGRALFIHRGHSLRLGSKFQQYRDLAAELIASKHYMGSTFSYGDRYAHDCANSRAGTGNAGTWVLVDQNHHFVHAVIQIDRLMLAYRPKMTTDELLAIA